MSETQMIYLFCLLAVLTRIPRILERWKAPVLRGPDWIFNVEVPAMSSGDLLTILRRYRLQLFLPWAVELPIFVALLLTRRSRLIIPLIVTITLFTRLNYYAARKSAEDRARPFEPASKAVPLPTTLALSLQPRTLAAYTNWWVEGVIVLALGASLAWLAYCYAASPDSLALRSILASTLMTIYLQGGMLLIKRAFILARSVAPAEDAQQYLAWRDSLRRLSVSICDYVRLISAFFPLGLYINVQWVEAGPIHWTGSKVQTVTVLGLFVAIVTATSFEWGQRLRYLRVARQTKPANFLVAPDLADSPSLVCFRPALPMLLLTRARRYTLNLASNSAKVAGLYIAGLTALWFCLTR